MPGPECTSPPHEVAPGAFRRRSPVFHLLRDPAAAPGQVPGGQNRPSEAEDRRVLCCARCNLEVADTSAIFSAGPGGPVQAFANPSGFVWEILTVREARNLAAIGPSTRFFSWFQGYSWRVALCTGCGSHLGWLWEAESEIEPASFWGLIRTGISGGG